MPIGIKARRLEPGFASGLLYGLTPEGRSPGEFMEIKQDVTIKTWDGTWTYHPKVLVTPESVEDLVEILSDEVRFPSPVRPAGSMHSTARMNGDDGGTMVDMKAMNRILHFTDDTVTVEAGATYIVVSNALKERGLQFHVTTEIGNVTLGAMATAATKDFILPRRLRPDQLLCHRRAPGHPRRQAARDHRARQSRGDADHPLELRAVRHRLRGDHQGAPDHRAGGAPLFAQPRKFPQVLPDLQGARLRGDVLHLPLREARAGRVAQGQSRGAAHLAPSLGLPQPLLAQIRAGRHAVDPAQHQEPGLRSLADKLHFFVLRQALVVVVRSDRTWPHAQIINYPRDPGANKYLFSMWAFREGGFFDILEEYCNFCLAYEKATGYRCNLPSVGYAIARDVEALLSYSWEGSTLSIDPASTGGPEWEEFLHHYNEFCSARRGVPLFNQTPFLTRDQVRKAFGVRIQQFAARRKAADPKNRMLDSYFRDLLS